MVNIRCHKIDKVSPCGPEPKMQTILAVWSACVQVRNCRPFCKHWKLPKCQLSRPVLFRSILALSKPYRSHCLNGTGLLATKCSKSTTDKNYHQETTHILNSFYSCSCYHFIPAAVLKRTKAPTLDINHYFHRLSITSSLGKTVAGQEGSQPGDEG